MSLQNLPAILVYIIVAVQHTSRVIDVDRLQLLRLMKPEFEWTQNPARCNDKPSKTLR